LARPRTNFVDSTAILTAIHHQAAEQRAELLRLRGDAPIAGLTPYRRSLAERTIADALELSAWVARDLQRLAGRPLTASQRKSHQAAVRALAADGLVDLLPRRIRLTASGRKALNETP
jgi:hypothetical protein